MASVAPAPRTAAGTVTFDLARQSLRELNRFLHHDLRAGVKKVRVLNPDGAHNIAVGVDAPVEIEVDGHAGYYAAGMNKQARVLIRGNAGPGVAEGMASGVVHVKGFASVSAGAAGHGGLLVIEGDASLRCGISMKGLDIVVGGSVGDFSAFMAQAGRLIVCGDAGDARGRSPNEQGFDARGKGSSFGADAHEEPMRESDYVVFLDERAAVAADRKARLFRRVASKRELYH